MLKGAAAPAVPALRKALQHDDLWLRVKAAEALAAIGEPAMSAVPELLEMLAKGPSENDPRGMEQRYLCFAVLRADAEAIARRRRSRRCFCKAVAAGLQNQDGRARGTVGGIYQQLSYEEIKPLLPAIHEAIVTPAPSGIMFASGIRLAGIELLAKHRIKEGMPLCIEVMEIDKWGKRDRISRCLKTLATYGGRRQADAAPAPTSSRRISSPTARPRVSNPRSTSSARSSRKSRTPPTPSSCAALASFDRRPRKMHVHSPDFKLVIRVN